MNLRPSSGGEGGGPGNRPPSGPAPGGPSGTACRCLPSGSVSGSFLCWGPGCALRNPRGLLASQRTPFLGGSPLYWGEGAGIRKGSLSKWGGGLPSTWAFEGPQTQPRRETPIPNEGAPFILFFCLSHRRGAAACPPEPPESHSRQERRPVMALGCSVATGRGALDGNTVGGALWIWPHPP